MRAVQMTIIVTLGVGGLIAAVLSGRQLGADPQPRVPVLAELFTSEGCSSCPPADALLRRLIERQPVDGVEVIGLSEHVDYWNRLGWRDQFSAPHFSQRQNDYAQVLRTGQIYTPQLVINGRLEVVGSDWPEVQRALAEAAKAPPAHLTVSASRPADGGTVAVQVVVRELPLSAAGGGAHVVVAVVEDELVTEVLRGENARKRLYHSAVVRALETIGTLDIGARSGRFAQQIDLGSGWRRDRLRVVAFAQDAATQSIVGVGATELGMR